MFQKLLAAADPIGQIKPVVDTPGITAGGELTGFVAVFNVVLRIIFIIGGILALFNIVTAGISFINAGGDPKKVSAAWEKIWMSFVGLVIIVSSFLIAAIIGIILFGDPTYILNPTLTPVK